MTKKINLVQLLESVDANALRSPDVLEKLQVMLENAVTEAKTDAAEAASKAAIAAEQEKFKKEAGIVTEQFNSMLEQQKQQLDSSYAAKLQEAILAVEARLAGEHAGVTRTMDENACTELGRIVEAYEQKLEEMDTQHCEMLKNIVEKLVADNTAATTAEIEKQDAEHAAKMEQIVADLKKVKAESLNVLDLEHTKLLEQIVEKYTNQIDEAKKAAVPVVADDKKEAGSSDLLATKTGEDKLPFDAAVEIHESKDWSLVPASEFPKVYQEAKQAYIKRVSGQTFMERLVSDTVSVLNRSDLSK